MRLIIFGTLSALLLCSVVATAWVNEQDISPSDLKAISSEPLAKPRDGKNVAVTLEVKSGKQLPRGVSIVVNRKQVALKDDGNWPDLIAGDGIFTVGAKTTDGEPLKRKTSLRLDVSSHHSEAPSVGCTFKRVECPKDCRSILFGSKCVVCLELTECTISFLD